MANPQPQQEEPQPVTVPVDSLKKVDRFNVAYDSEAIKKSGFPVLDAIFRRHFLYIALSHSPEVPETFVQQIWYTIKFKEEDKTAVEARVGTNEFSIDLDTFRTLLQLPTATSREGFQEYENIASEEQLFQDIKSLGYEVQLTGVAEFNRKHLPHIYAQIFTILNRCLSAKNTGADKCNLSLLYLFHGVVFNKHYDFAKIMWQDFLDAVRKKQKTKFIAHHRFISFYVADFLLQGALATGPNDPMIKQYKLTSLNRKTGADVQAARLLEGFLGYANQNARSVRACLASLEAPMVLSHPEVPTHGANQLRGEGNKGLHEQGQSSRNIDLSEQRENEESGEIERGAFDTDNQASQEKISSQVTTTPEVQEKPSDHAIVTPETQQPLVTEPQEPVTEEAVHITNDIATQDSSITVTEELVIEESVHDSEDSIDSMMNEAVRSIIVEKKVGVENLGDGGVEKSERLDRVNVTATLNLGRTTTATVDSTVSTTPCEPGVIGSMFPTKEDVNSLRKELEKTKEEMKVGLQKFKDEVIDKLDGLARLMKGKGLATSSEVPMPIVQQPKEQDIFIGELKDLLVAKLTSSMHFNLENMSLLEFLRSQMSQSQHMELRASMEDMTKRLKVIEDSYKSEASMLKRKHDGHQDDHHEGDKRQRFESEMEMEMECKIIRKTFKVKVKVRVKTNATKIRRWLCMKSLFY